MALVAMCFRQLLLQMLLGNCPPRPSFCLLVRKIKWRWRKLLRFWEYTISDEGTVEIKDHIEISTGERVEVERDERGGVLAVYIVPARGPAVGISHRSSSVVGSCGGPLYRRGRGGRGGGRRRRPRLPQR